MVLPYANYLFIIFPLVCGGGLLSPILWPRLLAIFFINWENSFWWEALIFLLDAAILNFFLVATKLTAGLPQTGFKGASFVLGIVSSYLLNKHWTFSADSKKTPKRNCYVLFL